MSSGGPGGPDDADNPFKGTPFEQIFGALGGAFGGPGGGADFFSQIQAMMQPHEGPLNWDVAIDLARRAVAAEPDPTPNTRDASRVADSIQLADHWLDTATAFPSGVSTTAAWSRADWIVETRPVDVLWRA